MKTYQQTVTNSTSADKFIGDVLLCELDDLSTLGLDKENCHLFRSGRHKNDMPSVCTFGVSDDAMKDCMCAVKENGEGREESKSNLIVSDHLTILGNDNNAVFIAFMSGDNQLFRTEIYVDEQGNFLKLKAYAEFNCMFHPGESRKTETLQVWHSDNVSRDIKEWAIKRAGNKAFLSKPKPAVFCTWYYYGQSVTYDDVTMNLEQISEKQLPFTVFQVDDGWEITVGEWEANDKFPPMKEVADEIKSAGLTPGIWTAPFVAHESSTVWKNHPEWILKDKNKKPLIFNVNDTDYYIFDISISDTWDYFESLYHRLTFDWGYTYHKLDFTRAPVVAENACFANPYMTIAQCYRNAVKSIRKGMGDESYFLMCGGLYDPLIGIVDAQRTGSDVLSMWSSTINKNGKTAPYTIKQSLLRYYMNNWWHNDPDALMIRRNETMERNSRLTYGLLNDEEVKTVTLNQLIGGGLVCSTEPLDKIDTDRLAVLKHILPVRDVEVQLVDLMKTDRFPGMVRLKADNATYLVIINYSDDSALTPCIPIKKIAVIELLNNVKYSVTDFYSRQIYNNLTFDSVVTLEKIQPHGATIIKLKQGNTNISDIDFDGHYLM